MFVRLIVVIAEDQLFISTFNNIRQPLKVDVKLVAAFVVGICIEPNEAHALNAEAQSVELFIVGGKTTLTNETHALAKLLQSWIFIISCGKTISSNLEHPPIILLIDVAFGADVGNTTFCKLIQEA